MQIRLFVDSSLNLGKNVVFDASRHHYLRNVLRANINDELFLFNGKDGEFLATLSLIDKKQAVACVQKQTKKQEFPRPVRLYFAPLKRDCTDWLVEKSTELGVTDLYPVITEYTNTGRINEERMRTIAIEASEQSRRLTLPEIHPLLPLSTILQNWTDENGILLHADEKEETMSFSKTLENITDTQPVSFLIGPEGGFSQKERNAFKRYVFMRSFSLGKHILRAETASLTVLSGLLCR